MTWPKVNVPIVYNEGRLPMLLVSEVFHSIQGESTRAGSRCVFIRLAGCNLRCSWCDTAYAFSGGVKRAVDELVHDVLQHECPLVEVTGGEPLLQEGAYPLMDRLLDAGRTVLLETGGHLSVERVPAAVIKIVDVKCPASGEAGRMDWGNLDRLSPHDEVKFVLADRADYEYARDILTRCRLADRCAAVLFSPAHGLLEPLSLACWVLDDRLPARVQLQMHKYIWGAGVLGV